MNVLALNIMSIFTYTRTLGSIVDLASEKAAIVRYQYYIDIINTLHLPYKVNENVSHRPNIYPEFYYCLYFSHIFRLKIIRDEVAAISLCRYTHMAGNKSLHILLVKYYIMTTLIDRVVGGGEAG